MTDTTLPTEREFLVALGLAQPTRGRFSNAAKAALDEARAKGQKFREAEKVVRTTPAPKPKVEAAPAVPTQAAAPLPEVDAKAVRAWARQVGKQVGERGRLHADLVREYVAANGGTAPRAQAVSLVKASAPSPAQMPKRKQTVAYGYIRRGPNDGPHVTEPLLAIESCGKCKAGIRFCGCPTGPRLPKWAGGEVAMLTRPSL